MWSSPPANAWNYPHADDYYEGGVYQNYTDTIALARYNSPGNFNDADMLLIGDNGQLTRFEQRSQFSLWAVMGAPLMISTDVRRLAANTARYAEELLILKNREIHCRQPGSARRRRLSHLPKRLLATRRSGTLIQSNGRCLDVFGGRTGDATSLIGAHPCGTYQSNQAWNAPSIISQPSEKTEKVSRCSLSVLKLMVEIEITVIRTGGPRMIEPYNAVGLIPEFWGIRAREDISRNIEHIENLTAAALWLSDLDIPVKLLAIPEGALQGFNDEILDVEHSDYTRTCAIDIPGPETERLGRLARQWDIHLIAQAKARHPEWPGLFFNVGFVINPDEHIALQHYKLNALLPVERSVSPHDLFDWWIERYGCTLDAFWPVVDTPIGRIGVMMAMEGNYPENGRGLALNGAEVVYRASLPVPFTQNDIFEISNRARALENNIYVVAPNISGNHLFPDTPHPIDAGGGRSMVVDYRGRIVGKQFDTSGGSTFVSGVIDIEALRHHRTHAQVTNWLKDVRAELAQIIYQRQIYPANRYLKQMPPQHEQFRREVTERQIDLLRDRDIWREPYQRETDDL